MPDTETRIDKLSPEEREKHLRETIAKKKDQRGTADAALKVAGRVDDVPLAAKDELKALRAALRDVITHDDDRIETLRAKLAELQAQHHPPADSGALAAVKFGLAEVGVTEMPAGSNWGHPVEDWIQRTGYGSPVPWCGCFVHECVVGHGHAAIPVGVRMGYGPSIIADAHAGANGFHAVAFADAQAGDVLVFWGGEHIGLCRGKPTGSTIPTVEGNTSPSTAGSQFNGGCVASKSRNQSDVTVVARPTYPKAG